MAFIFITQFHVNISIHSSNSNLHYFCFFSRHDHDIGRICLATFGCPRPPPPPPPPSPPTTQKTKSLRNETKSDVSLVEKHGNPINRGLLEGLNEHLTCLGSCLLVGGGSQSSKFWKTNCFQTHLWPSGWREICKQLTDTDIFCNLAFADYFQHSYKLLRKIISSVDLWREA